MINLPSKFTTFTKYNAVEVMQKIEGLIDCCEALEARLSENETKLSDCGSCVEKNPTKKKTTSK